MVEFSFEPSFPQHSTLDLSVECMAFFNLVCSQEGPVVAMQENPLIFITGQKFLYGFWLCSIGSSLWLLIDEDLAGRD